MEYDDIIRKVGGFGNYQKILMCVIAFPCTFCAFASFSLNFTFGSHNHRCKIPGHADHYSPPGEVSFNTSFGIQIFNVSECKIQVNGTTSACTSWVYDKSLYTATIISKFDIVCEHKFFRAHFLMAHYIGLLVGSVVGGVLSDMLGRKPVMAIGIGMLLVSMGIRPLIPNLMVVTVLEFFNGVGSMISYLSPFILLTEMVGPKHRLLTSFVLYFTFCIGNYVLLLMAYLVRDWAMLFWVITVPIGAYIIVIFFISESPRWLLSRGQTKKAIEILERVARFNGRTVHLSADDIIVKDHHKTTFSEFVRQMMRSKRLMCRLAVISFNWFALNLTYYGISMNVAKFGGSVYANFAASSSAEILAILVCGLLTNRIGRKRFFIVAMILSGLMCICTIFTTLYVDKSLSWLTTTLAMIGKFFNTITFFVVYIFTAELFPTVLRASALGVSSMAGRIGSISSAYVGELGSVIPNEFGIALPLIILGAIGVVAGLISITLPETTDVLLPENVQDAKVITIRKTNTGLDIQELESLAEKMG